MRVVLDTNILLSAIIVPAGNPAAIYNAWEQGKFTLLTCTEHLDEVRALLAPRKRRVGRAAISRQILQHLQHRQFWIAFQHSSRQWFRHYQQDRRSFAPNPIFAQGRLLISAAHLALTRTPFRAKSSKRGIPPRFCRTDHRHRNLLATTSSCRYRAKTGDRLSLPGKSRMYLVIAGCHSPW
jgi:hypothetical protein